MVNCITHFGLLVLFLVFSYISYCRVLRWSGVSSKLPEANPASCGYTIKFPKWLCVKSLIVSLLNCSVHIFCAILDISAFRFWYLYKIVPKSLQIQFSNKNVTSLTNYRAKSIPNLMQKSII